MNSVTPFLPYSNCQDFTPRALSCTLVAEHIEKAHIYSNELNTSGKNQNQISVFF